jgi:hypothetical protein
LIGEDVPHSVEWQAHGKQGDVQAIANCPKQNNGRRNPNESVANEVMLLI